MWTSSPCLQLYLLDFGATRDYPKAFTDDYIKVAWSLPSALVHCVWTLSLCSVDNQRCSQQGSGCHPKGVKRARISDRIWIQGNCTLVSGLSSQLETKYPKWSRILKPDFKLPYQKWQLPGFSKVQRKQLPSKWKWLLPFFRLQEVSMASLWEHNCVCVCECCTLTLLRSQSIKLWMSHEQPAYESQWDRMHVVIAGGITGNDVGGEHWACILPTSLWIPW